MNGKPQDYMGVGMIHFMACPQGPVVETLAQLCADDYFSVVEVTAIPDPEQRKKAIETVRAAGKRVFFGAQPVLLGGKHNLNAADPGARRAAVDAAARCLVEAAEWQAEGMAVLSGADPGEAARPLAGAYLSGSLKELCEISRRGPKIPLVLEVFDRLPYGKNCLAGPTAESADIAIKVAAFYPSFGLAIDLSHLPLLGETPAQAVAAAGHLLKHVHIGNCVMRDSAHPAYGDNHPIFGCEGGENGVEQLTAFLKALLDVGYIAPGSRNVVSFEIKPFGKQTHQDVIANARETLDAAWVAL